MADQISTTAYPDLVRCLECGGRATLSGCINLATATPSWCVMCDDCDTSPATGDTAEAAIRKWGTWHGAIGSAESV